MSAALELMDRLTLPFWLRRLFQALHEGQPGALDERAVAALLSWLGLARTDDGQQLMGLVGQAGSDQALLGQVFDVLDDWLFQDGQLHRQRAGVGALVPAGARRRRYRLLLSAYHPDRFPDHAERLTGCSQAIVAAYRQFKAETDAQAQAPAGAMPRTGPVPASGVVRPAPETGSHRQARRRGWQHVLQRRWGNDRWFGHKLVALLALLAFLPVLNLFLAPVPALKPGGMIGEAQQTAEPEAESAAMVEAGRYPASAAGAPAGADTSVSPSADLGARVPLTPLAAGEGGASLPPPVSDEVHPSTAPSVMPEALFPESALTAVLVAEPDDDSTAAAQAPPPTPLHPSPPTTDAMAAAPRPMPGATRIPSAITQAGTGTDSTPIPVPASARVPAPFHEGTDIAATAPAQVQATTSPPPPGPARHPAAPVDVSGLSAARPTPDPSSTAPSSTSETPGTAPAAAASVDAEVPVLDVAAVPPRQTTMRSERAAEELAQRQDGLVRAYQRSIETGDLATLGPLLAADVRENDHDGRDALLGMYRGMFQRSRERSLTLVLRERWQEGGSWVLLADYRLSVRFPNEQLVSREGQVRYRVREEGGGLVIAAIEY